MNDSLLLSSLITPLVRQFEPHTILTAGEMAATCLQSFKDTRMQHLTTPYSLQQLTQISPVDLAVISHLTETLDKTAGQQWLGAIRNQFAPHILIISNPGMAQINDWQLTDYLAMGFTHIAGSDDGLQVYRYAIESYQPKRDWLNSRFWAHPELYDKHRW